MEKEVNQVAQQWFHNHFGNIVIHELFDKISKKNFPTWLASSHPNHLIPSFGWTIKFYLGLAILDDLAACKSCNQIITRFCASSMDEPMELFL